ncbi:hypothetical protein H1C71_027141, partial [Ictidomys tridecemlineatus]
RTHSTSTASKGSKDPEWRSGGAQSREHIRGRASARLQAQASPRVLPVISAFFGFINWPIMDRTSCPSCRREDFLGSYQSPSSCLLRVPDVTQLGSLRWTGPAQLPWEG